MFQTLKICHINWSMQIILQKHSTYRGKVPQVPQVGSYVIKFWIRYVPSSGKQLGNHIPHTRKTAPTTLV
jgi:hypothetical protein